MKTKCITMLAVGAAALTFSVAGTANEFTANAAANNNYIWRGLTQTENEAAISGGLDYAFDNGFYIGTWASNVSYAPGDVFSYEHDLYAGFSGESGGISYDIGYLYYNYDDEADFDFGEIYGSVGYGGFFSADQPFGQYRSRRSARTGFRLRRGHLHFRRLRNRGW